MRKIWSRWCKAVEKHNESLDNYVFHEEMWTPYTPLVPVIAAVIISTLMILAIIFLEICPEKTNTEFAIMWAKSTVCQSIAFGLFFAINWIVFSDKDE